MDVDDIPIMVVDDSKSIRLVMKKILNRLNMEDITFCEDGAKALTIIKQDPEHYHLIFIDLNMPEMDGMALIRQLGSARFNGAVVIASQMEHRVINLASDIAKKNHIHLIGNLKKPFDISQMECILEKYRAFRQRSTPTMNVLSVDEIRQAINQGRLMPYYQPKVDINTNQIHSLEVLARIDSPGDGGAITPVNFISIAENHNLINLITFHLLKTALFEYAELESEIGDFFTLSINISALQLEDLNMPDKFDAIVLDGGLTAKKITIEVTEEHALKTDKQLETLNRFRIKGYGIALDDFGTGFTNISQLLSLPFTEVKIDRSLIAGINDDQFSQVIVNSLIDLTSKMEIELVAEGIETIEELEYFVKFKALILLQGYLFTKPKPKDELIHWYHSWKKTILKNV